MKPVLFWVVGILLLGSCGPDEENEKPVRIAPSGMVLNGPAVGRDRYVFPSGESANFPVSGTMQITVPKGIFQGTAFPADVSYAVRSASGGALQGVVAFPRLLINNEGRFQGDVSSGTTVAVISGVFNSDATSATIDVQGFSAQVSSTEDTVRYVILQGQLNADMTAPK